MVEAEEPAEAAGREVLTVDHRADPDDVRHVAGEIDDVEVRVTVRARPRARGCTRRCARGPARASRRSSRACPSSHRCALREGPESRELGRVEERADEVLTVESTERVCEPDELRCQHLRLGGSGSRPVVRPRAPVPYRWRASRPRRRRQRPSRRGDRPDGALRTSRGRSGRRPGAPRSARASEAGRSRPRARLGRSRRRSRGCACVAPDLSARGADRRPRRERKRR